MKTDRLKWRADRGARALKAISEIEASITALSDEDLLDLQDIFITSPNGFLAIAANQEVQRRNISG